LKPHSKEWYERLAALQSGYFYPWRSRVEAGNGEEAYREWVQRHVTRRTDVLDVACGHGDHALELAPACHSIVGFDRARSWIERAERERVTRGVANASFVCHDSSPEANAGRARLPGESGSYDLLIARRAPLHWLEDARRVARPGASLILLYPEGSGALTRPLEWTRLLPEPFAVPAAPPELPLWRTVREKLEAAGLEPQACCTYEVREWFDDPHELYKCLSFWWLDGGPTWQESRAAFEEIFRAHAQRGEIPLPHGRTLWQAGAP
jgi:SAM-dependent methyltransferase